jgi:hypothetical protein
LTSNAPTPGPLRSPAPAPAESKASEVLTGQAVVPAIEPFDPQDPPLPLEFFQTRYQLSRTTLYRYRVAGLRAIGVGAKTFVRESDLVRFLTEMTRHRKTSAAPAQEGQSHD